MNPQNPYQFNEHDLLVFLQHAGSPSLKGAGNLFKSERIKHAEVY